MGVIGSKTIRKFSVVGTRPIRPDGIEKVTGKALYGADLYAPNMLVGKMLRISEAHARIKSINTSKAEKLPGVKAVITFKDFMKVKTNKSNVIPYIDNLRCFLFLLFLDQH